MERIGLDVRPYSTRVWSIGVMYMCSHRMGKPSRFNILDFEKV